VSPVKYELGFYIPEDDILHSDRRAHPKSYTNVSVRRCLTGRAFRLLRGGRYDELEGIWKETEAA
jgi:hypothetical protein